MALRYVDLLHDRVKTSPNIDQHIGEAISNLEILLHDKEDNIVETIHEATDQLLERFQEKLEGKHQLVKTPFETLDHILSGGLSRGEFLVISSMSGQGKSMLQGQFMSAFCEQGLKVGVIGLEMESYEYAGRAISQVAADDSVYCLNQNNFKNPEGLDLGEDSLVFQHLETYSKKVANYSAYFIKPKIITVDEFKAMCKLLVNKYRCDVIFLDHMLLVSSKFEQPKLVEELSNFMKTFATENNIICAAISQMTRGTDLYNPSISNMAGGRAIEHAATTLLGITKVAPKEKNPFDDEEEEIDFRRKIVGMKIRDSSGDNYILTSFEGQNARFKEIYPNNWDRAKTKKLHEPEGRLEYGI
jgi:replicative DNA helicase